MACRAGYHQAPGGDPGRNWHRNPESRTPVGAGVRSALGGADCRSDRGLRRQRHTHPGLDVLLQPTFGARHNTTRARVPTLAAASGLSAKSRISARWSTVDSTPASQHEETSTQGKPKRITRHRCRAGGRPTWTSRRTGAFGRGNLSSDGRRCAMERNGMRPTKIIAMAAVFATAAALTATPAVATRKTSTLYVSSAAPSGGNGSQDAPFDRADAGHRALDVVAAPPPAQAGPTARRAGGDEGDGTLGKRWACSAAGR
jgi:hypothetical protein